MSSHCDDRFEIDVNCQEGTESAPDGVKFLKATSSEQDPIIEINFENLEHVSTEGDKKKFKVKTDV